MNMKLEIMKKEVEAIEREQLKEAFHLRVESWERREESRKLMLRIEFDELVRKHEAEEERIINELFDELIKGLDDDLGLNDGFDDSLDELFNELINGLD